MEGHPLIGEVLIKDVLGFNAPRLAVAAVRSEGDFWDTARNEFGNTTVTMIGSYTLPFVFRALASLVSGQSRKVLRELGTDATKATTRQKLGHLAGSFGFLFPFALAFTAVPFFRNALTLQKTGTANFEQIIGMGEAPDGLHKKKQRSYQDELNYQLGQVKKYLTLGAVLGLASTVGLGLLTRAGSEKLLTKLKKPIDGLFNAFRLHGKLGNEISGDINIAIFWLTPAYLGYIISARGKHERREQIIKTTNSYLWFLLFNRLFTKPGFANLFREAQEKLGVALTKGPAKWGTLPTHKGLWQWMKYRNQLPQWIPSWPQINNLRTINPTAYKVLQRLKIKTDLTMFGISILMLATTPAILNVILTRNKVIQERQKFATKNSLRGLPMGLAPQVQQVAVQQKAAFPAVPKVNLYAPPSPFVAHHQAQQARPPVQPHSAPQS